MRNMLFAVVLFFAASCNSGENSSPSSDSIGTTKGNSPGSNIIEMDTLHMDTSSQNIKKDSSR